MYVDRVDGGGTRHRTSAERVASRGLSLQRATPTTTQDPQRPKSPIHLIEGAVLPVLRQRKIVWRTGSCDFDVEIENTNFVVRCLGRRRAVETLPSHFIFRTFILGHRTVFTYASRLPWATKRPPLKSRPVGIFPFHLPCVRQCLADFDSLMVPKQYHFIFLLLRISKRLDRAQKSSIFSSISFFQFFKLILMIKRNSVNSESQSFRQIRVAPIRCTSLHDTHILLVLFNTYFLFSFPLERLSRNYPALPPLTLSLSLKRREANAAVHSQSWAFAVRVVGKCNSSLRCAI